VALSVSSARSAGRTSVDNSVHEVAVEPGGARAGGSLVGFEPADEGLVLCAALKGADDESRAGRGSGGGHAGAQRVGVCGPVRRE
jgi:hypothetical protein